MNIAKSKKIIINAVCDAYLVSPRQLLGKGTKRELTEPRQCAIYLMRKIGFGISDISKAIRRDRSTIYYALNQYGWAVVNDEKTHRAYEHIIEDVSRAIFPNDITNEDILSFAKEYAQWYMCVKGAKKPDMIKLGIILDKSIKILQQ